MLGTTQRECINRRQEFTHNQQNEKKKIEGGSKKIEGVIELRTLGSGCNFNFPSTEKKKKKRVKL